MHILGHDWMSMCGGRPFMIPGPRLPSHRSLPPGGHRQPLCCPSSPYQVVMIGSGFVSVLKTCTQVCVIGNSRCSSKVSPDVANRGPPEHMVLVKPPVDNSCHRAPGTGHLKLAHTTLNIVMSRKCHITLYLWLSHLCGCGMTSLTTRYYVHSS